MLRDAHRSLQHEHAALVGDVVDGKRFFWLGSGISRDQVPDLVAVLTRVLRFLRDRALSESPGTAHRHALLEILCTHLPTEVPRYEADEAAWVPIDPEPLREVYSQVLGVRVGDLPGNYLLMTAADLPNTYGADDLEPGVTHRLIAILIAEGVLKEIASGNWDGLVETSVERLTNVPGLLDVYVLSEDLREGNSMAQIAKFHGCAVLTRKDPARYSDKIVATRAQISRFESDDTFKHMREALQERTTKYRSLILGLSIQHNDLLNVFTRAAVNHPWHWEATHPAYVFAQPSIQGAQRDVLENGYADDYEAHHLEIIATSAFGTYAEPLLAALVLEVLLQKLLALLARQTTVDAAQEDSLAQGVRRVAMLVAASAADDEQALLTFVTGPYAALVRQYLGLDTSHRYVPLARGHRTHITSDPMVSVTGVDLLAIAIGLLGWGDLRGRWRIRSSSDQTSGDVHVIERATGRLTQLAIVKGAREADAVLASDAWTAGTRRMAILYMHERPQAAVRSAASRLGGGRRILGRIEAHWSELSAHVSTTDEITERFHTEVAL